MYFEKKSGAFLKKILEAFIVVGKNKKGGKICNVNLFPKYRNWMIGPLIVDTPINMARKHTKKIFLMKS